MSDFIQTLEQIIKLEADFHELQNKGFIGIGNYDRSIQVRKDVLKEIPGDAEVRKRNSDVFSLEHSKTFRGVKFFYID